MLNWIRKYKNIFLRGVFFLIGVCICALGVDAIYSGKPGYSNYWGGNVGAGNALVIGILLVCISTFFWKRFSDVMSGAEEKKKPRTRAERLAARKAAKKKLKPKEYSPWDDYRKW